MKRHNRMFIIATMVLGLGTITNASANNSSIEDSLKHVIVTQSKQLTVNLTEQLQQSVKLTLKQMREVNKSAMIDHDPQSVMTASHQVNSKNKSTTEEE